MSATGSGTGTPVSSPSGSAAWLELVTVTDIRNRYGDDVAELSDAAIRQELDRMVEQLEANLGHGFGRVGWAWSNTLTELTVSATALTLGADEYLFADYDTLAELEAAVNDAGAGAYGIDLAPHVLPNTPSALLRTFAAVALGPTYDVRRPLSATGLYWRGTGGESYIFLPLPVRSVSEVVESGTTLDSTAYWTQAMQPWLIRKRCACTDTECAHPKSRWLATYPDNISVTYTPVWWNQPPAQVTAVLADAYGAARGLGDVQSENFLGYSYSRKIPEARRWDEILQSSGLRRYQTVATW